MKKNVTTMLAIMVSLTALLSCTDEDITQTNGHKEGDVINFGVVSHATNSTDGTRTLYGDRSSDNTYYPVYWVSGDTISIYCPEASNTGTKTCSYAVTPTTSSSQNGTLDASVSTDALVWGGEGKHQFYAVYPKSDINIVSADSATIDCYIPLLQYPADVEYSNGVYTVKPDMKYAYMWAYNTVESSDKDVSLTFYPVVSTLEITIPGPSTEYTTDTEIDVSQIEIKQNDNKPLTGSFKMSLKNGQLTAITTNDATARDSFLTIPTYYDGKPITLKQGEKIVVKAFILPTLGNATAQTTDGKTVPVHEKDLSVTVRMPAKGIRTKVLDQSTIYPGKVNYTTLPGLSYPETSYYHWMSSLNEDTYVSQLSIPGGHNSYSIDTEANAVSGDEGDDALNTTFQTLSIEDQLKNGARAFTCIVGYNNNNFQDYSTYKDLYVYSAGEKAEDKLYNVIKEYADELQAMKTDYENAYDEDTYPFNEFVVLTIDLKQNSKDRQTEIKYWLKDLNYIINSFNNDNADVLVKGLSTSTTVKDLRGKILLLVNYQGADFASEDSYTYNLSNATCYNVMRKAYYIDNSWNGTWGSETDCSTLSSNDSHNIYYCNDRDLWYIYYKLLESQNLSISDNFKVYNQNLQRLNVTDGASVSNSSNYSTRITEKLSLIKMLVQQAISNNQQSGDAGLNNFYINNLGGFRTTANASSYENNRGESGKTIEAASDINVPIYNYLKDPNTNSGPLGFMLMNFLGVDKLGDTEVDGGLLTQLIIDNNFRFAKKIAK